MRETNNNVNKVFTVPHFHYDVEWWKTDDRYDIDVAVILEKAFEMLEEYPDFTYVIDSALALRPFWRAKPDMHEKIRGYIQQGRLEMVGGSFCSPDENIPTGESRIRQYIYGKKFFEDVVRCKSKVAWELDVFGHPAQIPQIVAGCGMKGYVFARGVQNWRDPSQPIHFNWESPDGTSILTNWFATHYMTAVPLFPSKKMNLNYFDSEVNSRMANESPRTESKILMMPFGTDFSVPNDIWIDFVEKWNSENETIMEFSLPSKFFDTLTSASSEKLPVIKGELNPIFTGCYESREMVKKLCRRSQYGIIAAEKWAALAWAETGADYPREELDTAWELILENDFHDIVCGTGTDKVYMNTLKRYYKAIENINSSGTTAKKALVAEFADTSGDGTKVTIFNSLNWAREEIVNIPNSISGLPDNTCGAVSVLAPSGQPISCQIIPGGLLIRATIPPLGFAVYSILDKTSEISYDENDSKNTSLKVAGLEAENEMLSIKIDPGTGGICSIYDKEQEMEILKSSGGGANVFLVEEDAGNLWTVQKTGRKWTGDSRNYSVNIIEKGPLRVGFEIRGEMKDMKTIRRVYLSAESPRIDCETDIDFKGKDRRVKVTFAPSFDGQAVFETPFYSQPRESGHHCAQNWTDISNGESGLAIINDGNPGMDAEKNSLGLVLFRSVSVASPALFRFLYKDRKKILKGLKEAAELIRKGIGLQLSEWALYDIQGIMLREWSSAGGPPMEGFTISDHIVPWLKWFEKSDAWEHGTHNFRYAIYPHKGDWQSANLPRAGWEFNTPLTCMKSENRKKGHRKSQVSFQPIESDTNAIMTALKLGENSDCLFTRIYDSSGNGSAVGFKDGKFSAIRITNMVEENPGRNLLKSKGETKVKLKPWEIATFQLEL